MLCDRIPRQRFAHLPTPLVKLPRLSALLGGPTIYLKRDDLTGLAFGGNKPRIFEFVFGDVCAMGCDVVIASAGAQSNHLRELASAANRLGIKPVLVLIGITGREEVQGNLLLFKLLGAEMHTLATRDATGEEVLRKLDELERAYRARGHKPYLVHRSKRSGILGSLAHVHAAEELSAQFREQGIAPDYVVVPAGSGGTMAGYVLGFELLGASTRVMGVNLVEGNEAMIPTMTHYIRRAADFLGVETRATPRDYVLLDQYVGPGHGVLTPEVTEAIRTVARSEGIFLDPTYNGKAMAALLDQIRRGTLGPRHTVVLVHTGGLPALFNEAAALAREAPETAAASA
jgi:D-cysteine desulfhydrase family pyridoxal phosphate-dependent enzyme